MLCPNCQLEFNSTVQIPRILIFCGHTFCQSCIESLLQQSTDEAQGKTYLNCPECDTQNVANDGINSFPKNLVLLQMYTQITNPSQQPKPQNNNDNSGLIQQNSFQNQIPSNENKLLRESSQKSSSNASQPQNNHDLNQVKVLCSIHGKKLEAFCEKDLQVLCIDCILSDAHKSHEIISVQKAAEKQRQILYEEVNNAQKTEEKLRFIMSDIRRHVSEMHSTADKNRKELSSIYSYVRDLILEREQTLKRQISENLTKEEQESEAKQSEINDFMGGINQLKQELFQQNQEHDIDILIKAKQRDLISGEVNGLRARELVSFNIQSVSSCSLSLQEIKREQELSQLSKIINPTYKGPSIGQTIGVSSNLYSHTASTANKMKKANTQLPTQASNNFPLGITGAQNPFQNENKLQREETRKIGKSNQNVSSSLNTNQVKTKVSPHRVQQKKGDISSNQNKKQNVMVLDQNKQKSANTQLNKNSSKCQGSFGNIAMQNQINLHNFNQFGHHQQSTQPTLGAQHDDLTEDLLGNMGAEDVSSIYPLETNDCYFQYQGDNQQNQKYTFAKRDESVGNLNDLLESLNKSSSGQQDLGGIIDNDKQLGTSTASETGGSHSDINIKTPPPQDFKLKQVKSSVESPKIKKGNPWKNQPVQQKKKSGKKNNFKKDNSTTDLDELKSKQQISNNQEVYTALEETKNEIRSGSLQRYGNNGILDNDNQNSISKKHNYQNLKNEDNDNKRHKFSQQNEFNNNHQMCSLSQERAKRKQMKMGLQSQEQSPCKIEKVNAKDNAIMEMLQECTKNIDKLEFRPTQMKQQNLKTNSTQESPIKLVSQNSGKAAVCVVDLTRRDDIEEFNVRKNEDKDQICYNEEEEGTHLKNIPNMTKPKDQSPLKKQFERQQSSSNSPNKKLNMLKSTESLDNLMVQVIKNQDTSLEISRTNQLNFGSETFLQQSVSVDTSVSDPFRAFCKIREEFIFVFSGFNDQKLLTCEALDVQRGTWKEVCQIGKARTKFSAVPISKSRILIFGGKQADGQRTGEIEEYNLKTNKFKTLPFKLPKPRSGFSSCVKREEGKIFFCGGNSGSVLKKFDCLDLKKGKWSRWPEMIQKRDELAVALGPDGKIYAIGGYGGGSASNSTQQTIEDNKDNNSTKGTSNQTSNCLRTAERFDFNTGEWEMLPEMNEARRALAAVALPDGIYAIGGYDGKQYLSSVEKFDLQKQQWIPVKSMNTSRCTLSAAVSSDCQYIYAIGGFNGNSLDLVERYNTMTDEWEFMTPMISKRFMHEAVCLVTH